MKKYLHIGYPKNFSTSLQRNFFSLRDEIYHLGIGVDSNVGYIDELCSSIFEVYLKSAKGFKYQEQRKKLKEHIDFHFNNALSQGKKCFGASSEHFSFGFTYESLGFDEKIGRAVDLFGDDLNVIVIIRNQADLIKSLYRESVRVGLPGSFGEFIYNLYKFQDRNYLYDLRYDMVYDSLLKHFSRNNIHFLMFENLRGKDGQMTKNKESRYILTDQLSSILNIDYKDIDFKHFNESLTDEEIFLKSQLNKKHRHDLGREMLFSAEIHRQAPYFKSELNLTESDAIIFEDVLTKRKLISEVVKNSSQESDFPLSYKCDNDIDIKLLDFLKSGNLNFSQNANIVLPNDYFNLKF